MGKERYFWCVASTSCPPLLLRWLEPCALPNRVPLTQSCRARRAPTGIASQPRAALGTSASRRPGPQGSSVPFPTRMARAPHSVSAVSIVDFSGIEAHGLRGKRAVARTQPNSVQQAGFASWMPGQTPHAETQLNPLPAPYPAPSHRTSFKAADRAGVCHDQFGVHPTGHHRLARPGANVFRLA
jgi:hypothetical protein